MMWYRIAADLVVVVHLLFICFVVGGAFLAWRWPWVIWVHLPAVMYGALIEFIGFTCPLTPVENYLRRHAGQAGYRGGFIAHYLLTVIYPAGLTRGVQVVLGMCVLVIAAAGYRGYLHRHAPGWRTWLAPGRTAGPPAAARAADQPTARASLAGAAGPVNSLPGSSRAEPPPG